MAGPSDTVDHLTQAINRGDLEAALALYEPNAVLVVQPGHLACGTTQLREALARFIALEPTLRSEAQEVIAAGDLALYAGRWTLRGDRKSTRLNSSHSQISYAVFCLKKKKGTDTWQCWTYRTHIV